ncbi:hypothetical protein [Acetivibrio saccincola]|uniref:Uncharacterized protein n=1 Tax=Acetivibrio saccincola TaxID=1677857 RepID=A0A2K9E9F9_9FIRM|nr:hypothetical protein [Acetivibrio saccincola]AUG58266.1 hypothetical protein HVS_11895 [Acetivibrio saccincola]
MMFENINSWLEFIKKTSLKDLTGVINEDFYLDEYVKNMESDIVNPELLVDIEEKIKGSEIEKLFWEKTLLFINVKCLKDELLDYLIDNNIANEILGHLKLPDKYLWKLVDKTEEAVLTLGKRMYIEEKYKYEEFQDFLAKFPNKYWLWNSLLNVEPICNEKKKILIKMLFKITNFDDLKKKVITITVSNRIKNTKSIIVIKKYYKTMIPEYLLAISQNPITPIYMLENLVNIERIKYANQIRNFSKINLSSKKGFKD